MRLIATIVKGCRIVIMGIGYILLISFLGCVVALIIRLFDKDIKALIIFFISGLILFLIAVGCFALEGMLEDLADDLEYKYRKRHPYTDQRAKESVNFSDTYYAPNIFDPSLYIRMNGFKYSSGVVSSKDIDTIEHDPNLTYNQKEEVKSELEYRARNFMAPM